METLERLALETGVSTWEAIGQAIKNQLLPARACAALDSFRQLIEDARAMMDPDFAGKLAADLAGVSAGGKLGSEAVSDAAEVGFGIRRECEL